MNFLTVLIVLKDGLDVTIHNVLHFRYNFESYRYKQEVPFFEVKEGIMDELDLVAETIHFFPLDIIDSIEVF